jgi:RimJ/RimL family protein N-acetyltransferase
MPEDKPRKKSRPIGRVRLRDVSESDLSVFFEDQRDTVAVAMAGFQSRDLDAFMTHWATIMADETVFMKTIVFDGRVAGNVVAFMMNGRREVGYWISRDCWGRGVATRAVRGFLKLFPERPLYAAVVRHNAGSVRVLEKCGFELQGEEGDELIFKLV